MLPSPDATDAQLRPWPVLRDCFARAVRLIVADNATAYIILAIFAVIDGALMRNFKYTGRDLFNNAYPLTAWLTGLAFYFTMAAAMRTLRPGYRMRIVDAFGITVSYLLVLIATIAGLFFLVVPGIWIGTRLGLAPYCYVLDPGESPYSGLDAVAASWNLTRFAFWPTMWLGFLQAAFLAVPALLVEILFLQLFAHSHFSAYVTAPLWLLVNVYIFQVLCLSSLEWTAKLTSQVRP